MTFDHVQLPNPGLTKGVIPQEIYQALNKEIVDIHSDDSNTMRMNKSLAGQITKEYQITKSRQLLDPYLEDMAKAYQQQWNYYPKENPNDNKLRVESVWVNMQKKLEVNPLHNHDGTLSFVAWLHIPFKLEDERKVENIKNSRTVELASTFQFVYSQVLGNVVNYPLFVDNGWEARIVMFPAKLLHMVYPFQTSDDYRISIAGNLY
tara:strand:- start:2316 stop:2933 length:618 start_codon:yes stop_codon:yes gene_type:complete